MLLGLLGNALMSLGELDEAESTYDQALALHRRVDNFYSVGFCLMHRAELVRRRGKLYLARRDLEQAIEVFHAFAELRHEGEALLKLCLLGYQSGELEPAREAAQRGAALFREHGSARLEAYALEHIGALWHATGAPEEAAGAYREALSLVDRVAAARILASLASVEITRGRLDAARAALADAADVDADDAILRIARARLALADGDRSTASAIADELREPAVPVPEVLVSRRLLEQALGPVGGLTVGPGARWFSLPGTGRVSLERRRLLRRVLERLVEARSASPGVALTKEALIEVGWPGEKMKHQAGLLRIYNAVATLRRLGLGEVLQSTEEGYLLDPSVTITVSDD
jgi:tetratricopeptide (TPR) repeat protein